MNNTISSLVKKAKILNNTVKIRKIAYMNGINRLNKEIVHRYFYGWGGGITGLISFGTFITGDPASGYLFSVAGAFCVYNISRGSYQAFTEEKYSDRYKNLTILSDETNDFIYHMSFEQSVTNLEKSTLKLKSLYEKFDEIDEKSILQDVDFYEAEKSVIKTQENIEKEFKDV